MQGDTGLYASGLADEVDESVRAPTESLKGTSKQGRVPAPPLEVSYIGLTCDWGLIIV